MLQKPHKVLSVKVWLLQYEKRLNNMDHMRISSTEPSSVILSQTKVAKKVEKRYHKSAKTNWSQKGLWINPKNYNFNKFKHGKCWCSRNVTNQLKSTVELGCMCPQGLSGPSAVTLTKWVKWLKYKKRPRCIHHFKSDFINNMEHMRISETELSSVIRSQTK